MLIVLVPIHKLLKNKVIQNLKKKIMSDSVKTLNPHEALVDIRDIINEYFMQKEVGLEFKESVSGFDEKEFDISKLEDYPLIQNIILDTHSTSPGKKYLPPEELMMAMFVAIDSDDDLSEYDKTNGILELGQVLITFFPTINEEEVFKDTFLKLICFVADKIEADPDNESKYLELIKKWIEIGPYEMLDEESLENIANDEEIGIKIAKVIILDTNSYSIDVMDKNALANFYIENNFYLLLSDLVQSSKFKVGQYFQLLGKILARENNSDMLELLLRSIDGKIKTNVFQYLLEFNELDDNNIVQAIALQHPSIVRNLLSATTLEEMLEENKDDREFFEDQSVIALVVALFYEKGDIKWDSLDVSLQEKFDYAMLESLFDQLNKTDLIGKSVSIEEKPGGKDDKLPLGLNKDKPGIYFYKDTAYKFVFRGNDIVDAIKDDGEYAFVSAEGNIIKGNINGITTEPQVIDETKLMFFKEGTSEWKQIFKLSDISKGYVLFDDAKSNTSLKFYFVPKDEPKETLERDMRFELLRNKDTLLEFTVSDAVDNFQILEVYPVDKGEETFDDMSESMVDGNLKYKLILDESSLELSEDFVNLSNDWIEEIPEDKLMFLYWQESEDKIWIFKLVKVSEASGGGDSEEAGSSDANTMDDDGYNIFSATKGDKFTYNEHIIEVIEFEFKEGDPYLEDSPNQFVILEDGATRFSDKWVEEIPLGKNVTIYFRNSETNVLYIIDVVKLLNSSSSSYMLGQHIPVLSEEELKDGYKATKVLSMAMAHKSYHHSHPHRGPHFHHHHSPHHYSRHDGRHHQPHYHHHHRHYY